MTRDDLIGQMVRVEETRGWATARPSTMVVEDIATVDDEGSIRVGSVNVTPDAAGYLPTGVLVLSIRPVCGQTP